MVLETQEDLGPKLLQASIAGAAGHPREAASHPVRGRPDASPAEILEEFESRIRMDDLMKNHFNQTRPAKSPCVALSSLKQKIQRLSIDVRQKRAEASSKQFRGVT